MALNQRQNIAIPSDLNDQSLNDESYGDFVKMIKDSVRS